MITQEQADKVREIVSGFDGEQKKQFLEKYASLDEKKKEVVVGRLLASATAETQAKPSTPSPESQLAGIKSRSELAQADIKSRGNLIGGITENLTSPNPLRKAAGVVGAIGAPFTALEAAVSNPGLQMQQGNFDPGRLLKESALGITGQKLGEYGDIYRVAGAPKPVAATVGLGTSLLTPAKSLEAIKNTFGTISKLSDRMIFKSGDNLLKAVDSAESFSGTKLNEAFKVVDATKAKPDEVLDAISKLPKPLIKKIEELLGPAEDIANNATIKSLRELKRTIGKYKPSSFGRDERGLADNLDAEDISKVYGTIKNIMRRTIKDSHGEKTMQKLMGLEDAFSEISRAGQSIKKTIVDATTQKATKAGAMASKLKVEGDLTSREALNVIRSAGPQARKEINNAVRALNRFNKLQTVSGLIRHGANALVYGGAIGAAGGSVFNRVSKQDS